MLPASQRASLSTQMGQAAANDSRLPAPIVSLKRCSIRPYHPTDAEIIAVQANSANVARYMRNRFPHPYTVQDAHDWIQLCATQTPTEAFAICDLSNSVIGAIGMVPQPDFYERTVELGYWLGESSWGRGIMSEVARGFIDWVFVQHGHIARIEARVVVGNEASAGVLEKVGFMFEGRFRKAVWKDGRMLDELMFSVIREDWEATHK